ncbi:hypothetical protein [uncultured Rhodospira sp.]|uniref:hypothetical protein n=1 Tax=uncultured Rhodospira sp. TaxID=1936189 RepID=UPI00262BFA0A|nr:hypothetical protein [uncultured Rhodospira sp.]
MMTLSLTRTLLVAGVIALSGGLLIGDGARAQSGNAAAEARAAVARAAESVTAGRPAEAVEALREATLAVWSAAPFDLTRVEATTEVAAGFRAFTPREPGPYAAGETLHLYIEPIGLAYEFEDGVYTLGMTADFLVLDTDGTVLGGQRNFADVPFSFHAPSTRVYMTMSLGTERLPAGDYVIQLTVHDAVAGDTVTREVPFSVAAP